MVAMNQAGETNFESSLTRLKKVVYKNRVRVKASSARGCRIGVSLFQDAAYNNQCCPRCLLNVAGFPHGL